VRQFTIDLTDDDGAVLDAVATEKNTTATALVQAEAEAKVADLRRDRNNARWGQMTAAQQAAAITAGEAA
jgi:hypothetical protein